MNLHTSTRCTAGLALVLAACTLAVPAKAQSGGMADRVQIPGTGSSLHLSQTQGAPLATPGALSVQDAMGGTRSSAQQTMLWAQHSSGVGVGVGVEQRGPYAGQSFAGVSPSHEAGMVMGLSLATSTHSHLVVQTPLLTSAVQPSVREMQMQQEPRQIRMGLVFHGASPVADLRHGLRIELDGQTTLAVKPRGGGRVGIALQSSW